MVLNNANIFFIPTTQDNHNDNSVVSVSVPGQYSVVLDDLDDDKIPPHLTNKVEHEIDGRWSLWGIQILMNI